MIELYGHPFSAFTWKALIALYERQVPFVFRMLGPDHPDNQRRIGELSPTGQFPALVEGHRAVTQSNTVIEYLDLHHGDAPPMVPIEPRDALPARMMAEIFDDYIAAPMQRIVAEALRPADMRDARRVDEASALLHRGYGWLESRIGDGWCVGETFGIADCAAAPALFYADWVHPITEGFPRLRAYRVRLLARPSVTRVIDEARPYRAFFPLGAPDRD